MGRRLALYSDILEKMSLGIDEYVDFYKNKVARFAKLSELKTKYENAKNGYEASLMINYDFDSKDFHEKNISKIKTELTVLKSDLYPITYSNNKIKSAFQKLFFIPYSKKNKNTSSRISELEERLKKSEEAYSFYLNKYELGCNYLKTLGFENNSKDKITTIKDTFDNTVIEYNSFILSEGKYFDNITSNDDFYKISKSEIEDQISETKTKMTTLDGFKNEFEQKKDTLTTVEEAKKLLSDINQKIMSVI